MRAWITGGSGFVGGHLEDAFDDVLAPSHAEVDVTVTDVDEQLRRLERSLACTT